MRLPIIEEPPRHVIVEALRPGKDGGGDGSVSSPFVRCPFAYNTSGILTGASVYIPAVGDVITGAFFHVITPWDGTTPSADFGQFSGTGLGVLALGNPFGSGVADLSQSDLAADGTGTGLVGPAGGVGGPGILASPLVVESTAPIKVTVSQDGNATSGTASIAAAGAPTLPITITTGVNDQFQFGPSGSLVTYTVAAGTYSTLTALATAMDTAMTGVANVVGFFGSLVCTAASGGAYANGYVFAEGNGFLAIADFAAGTGMAGGTGGDPGASHGSAVLYLVTGTPA